MRRSFGEDIFNPVAKALIESGTSEEYKRQVLGSLISMLCEQDWNQDESLREFLDDPVIVSLLYGERVLDGAKDGFEGTLSFDEEARAWVLWCECQAKLTPSEDGQFEYLLYEKWLGTGPFTIEGHNLLIDQWIEHCHEKHGGVDEKMQNAKLPVA